MPRKSNKQKQSPTAALINSEEKRVKDRMKLQILLEPEDIEMFRKIFPQYYVLLENIALRRIVIEKD